MHTHLGDVQMAGMQITYFWPLHSPSVARSLLLLLMLRKQRVNLNLITGKFRL